MCQTTVKLNVLTCEGWRLQDIDKCIAPIIESFNQAGIYTSSCCCGHEKEYGHIWLKDGRIIMILPSGTTKHIISKHINMLDGEKDEIESKES